MGGVSGPALRPIAVRCVYDLYQSVKIPIIGCGGITYGRDLIEMMVAGATAVQLATAVYYRGVNAFQDIIDEAQEWLQKHDYKNISDIIGLAHEK